MNYELRMKMEESTNNSQFAIRNSKLRRAFTLIEMLVVIGIIAILIGASIGGFSRMTKSADRAKTQELVSNAATALTALFQTEGNWPKRLASGGADGQLDKDAALILARGKYFSLSTDKPDNPKAATKLTGVDKFGIITPWAAAIVKRKGTSATESSPVSGAVTIKDHILHYALDLEGRGVVSANVGGETVKIRATAAVWCIGRSGGDGGKPWPYSVGRKKDDVYSWTFGQTQDAQ